MTPQGLPRLILAAALPVILSGCAIAAIPVAAGALVANRQMGDVAGIGLGGERTAGSEAAVVKPAVATAPSSTAEPRIVKLVPGDLPPPTASTPRGTDAVISSGDDPYGAFTRYALAQAAPMETGQVRRSALIDQGTLAKQPRLAECGDQPPAVVVDLDPGTEPFNLDNPPAPAPGLTESLAAIRQAGITVLWSASLPVASAEQLYTVLSASGLDPDRTDRLLLVRGEYERKQTRRLAAAQDWCILAVAGDRRADFDEAFDYLRDPEGPVALSLEPNIGAGWFLAPPPID